MNAFYGACGSAYRRSHGGVTLTSFATCQQCHHAPNVTQAAQCVRCHERRELVRPYRERATFKVAAAPQRQRLLTFQHSNHQSEPCTACHTPGLEMSAAKGMHAALVIWRWHLCDKQDQASSILARRTPT